MRSARSQNNVFYLRQIIERDTDHPPVHVVVDHLTLGVENMPGDVADATESDQLVAVDIARQGVTDQKRTLQIARCQRDSLAGTDLFQHLRDHVLLHEELLTCLAAGKKRRGEKAVLGIAQVGQTGRDLVTVDVRPA